jgi:hypothetical protein
MTSIDKMREAIRKFKSYKGYNSEVRAMVSDIINGKAKEITMERLKRACSSLTTEKRNWEVVKARKVRI